MKRHKAHQMLREAGFELVSTEGSHEKWKRGEETIIFPTHKGKEVKKYLVRKLEKLRGQ